MGKGEEVQNRNMSAVLRSLAESSSWHGIPKIASSPQRTVKCLWCILMLGAFAFMLWQLSELFTTFRSHPIQTTVSLEFSSHRFPAVSFCNLNPVRKSQIALSPKLIHVVYPRKTITAQSTVRNRSFTRATSPESRSTSTSPESSSISTSPESSSISTSSILISTTATSPLPSSSMATRIDTSPTTVTNLTTSTTPTTSPITNSTTLTSPITGSTKSPFSDSSNATFGNQSDANGTEYYDEYNFDYMDWDEILRFIEEYYNNNEYFEYDNQEINNNDNLYNSETDPRDQWEEVIRTFKTKFRNESVTKRKRMGHQMLDFIHRVTFATRQQNVTKHFKEFTSSDYGNCFTMDSPKYIAWRSGPDHGIKLRLNLEVDEYIKNFASGYGVRMVFHEPGTFPMPAEEGLTLSPGHETVIGLRVVNISRLDYPFGNCTEGEDFRQRYNVSYSVASCMEFCRVEMTIEDCNCIPFDAPDLNFSRTELHVCDNLNRTEDECADKVNYNFGRGKSKCDCISPCRETVYEKTISGRRWPNKDYLEKVLMADTCRRNMSSMNEACSQLQNKTFDYERYRYNFIRARIYFEELNYQQITEHEAYKPARFVSDIGGAMGLFLGASLLSILELFQLILEVVLHLRKPKQTQLSLSDATKRRHNQQHGNCSPV